MYEARIITPKRARDRRAIPLSAAFFKTLAIVFLGALLCAATLATSLQSQNVMRSTLEDRSERIVDPNEVRMLDLINSDRVAPSSLSETKGRAYPLQWDSRLAAVALEHSSDMARKGYFSHQGSDGSMPPARVSRAGIQWRATGENIARVYDVNQAEDLFMNEPKFQSNHRANVLNPNFTHVGVGIAKGPGGALYITQEFAQLR